MYRETLLDAVGSTVGYRFIWVFTDQSLDLNKGIEHLITRNYLRMKEVEKKQEMGGKVVTGTLPEYRKLVDMIFYRAEYVQHILAGHLCRQFEDHCVLDKWDSASNAANIYEALMYESNMNVLASRICPAQKDYAQYYNSATGTFMFPRGAQRMRPLYQHPNVQYHLRLFENQASEDWQRGIDPDQLPVMVNEQLYMMRKNGPVHLADHEKDAMDEMRDINLAELKKLKTPQEKYHKRRSREFSERYERLTMPEANISPALAQVFAWEEEEKQRLKAEGKPFSYRTRDWDYQDPTMDLFANAMARFMIGLDTLCGVSNLHEEILMAWFAKDSVYERAYALKFNIIYSGPPAAGKSFILDCIKEFSIEGTYREISHSTAKANTTEADMNGTTVLRDELPSSMFVGGTGDPAQREEMSTGRTTTSMIHIDDNGKRLQVITVCKVQTVTIGLTNAPVCTIAPATRSRCYCHAVAVYTDRYGHSMLDDKARKAFAGDTAESIAMEHTTFVLELKRIQALSAHVYTKIYLGQMSPPDLSTAIFYLRIYREKLEARGLTVTTRQQEQLMRFVLACTVK